MPGPVIQPGGPNLAPPPPVINPGGPIFVPAPPSPPAVVSPVPLDTGLPPGHLRPGPAAAPSIPLPVTLPGSAPLPVGMPPPDTGLAESHADQPTGDVDEDEDPSAYVDDDSYDVSEDPADAPDESDAGEDA